VTASERLAGDRGGSPAGPARAALDVSIVVSSVITGEGWASIDSPLTAMKPASSSFQSLIW
jgi:hypothetical protein